MFLEKPFKIAGGEFPKPFSDLRFVWVDEFVDIMTHAQNILFKYRKIQILVLDDPLLSERYNEATYTHLIT